MDRVAELTTIVQQEVADYAGPAYKAKTYYVEDLKRQIYTVIIVPDDNYPLNLKAGVTVLARIVGDSVVIDQDITDRPLYEELIRAGIPREQIVLAYAGESLPSESESQ
jgi:hypothetical protein